MRGLLIERLGQWERCGYWVLAIILAYSVRVSPAWAQLSGTTLGDEFARLLGVGSSAYNMIQIGSFVIAGFAGLGLFLCWLLSLRARWGLIWTVFGSTAGIALFTTVMDFVFVIDTPVTLTDGVVIQNQ